jgi:site-specific recombinase XerD
VTARDIDSFIDAQHGRSMAATTINRQLAALHTCFECMAAHAPDEVRPNTVHWRRHRVKEGHPIPRDASDQEVERLFGVIDR